MCDEVCRLCLTCVHLKPLFTNSDQIGEYSFILFVTTGLKIEAKDDLPQKICNTCSKAVNSAFNLRNQSQASEKLLLEQQLQRNKTQIEISNTPIPKDENESNIEDAYVEDFHDDSKLKETTDSSDENGAETKWPLVKKSKKEKRQMYLDLVEGPFDPKGPVKCKVCKTTVSKWSCFLSHAKLHLGFNFMCEFCGKSFITTTQLNRHCRSHHGMKRELECKHCSYLALDNAQMKLHERRVHTLDRPFICDACGSSYHSRRCLVQHIETHRPVADVMCASCPRVFKSRRALSRHRYSAHAHARAACPHCSRKYSRKYLNAHVKRCHAAQEDNN